MHLHLTMSASIKVSIKSVFEILIKLNDCNWKKMHVFGQRTVSDAFDEERLGPARLSMLR